MLARFGIDRNDLRNLGVFIVVMTVVMAYQFDGTVFVRLVSGLIAALLAGIVFLVVTAVIYTLRPEYR